MATDTNELTNNPEFRCVSLALEPLNASYIKSIVNGIRTATTLMSGYIATIQAQLIALDISSAPLLLQKAGLEKAAEAVSDSINSIGEAADSYDAGLVQVNVIARELTSQCPALGKVNEIAVQATEAPFAAYQRVKQQVDRIQALRFMYESKMNRLNAYVRYLNRIVTVCESVLTTKSAADTTWQIVSGPK